MKITSRSWLLVLLAIPVALVFFLRTFGKNRFDLPLLLQTSSDWPSGCPMPDRFPFVVPDTLQRHANTGNPVIFLLDAPPSEAERRIPVEIDTGRIRVIRALGNRDWSCKLGSDSDITAVLVDVEGRVRGQYTILDRTEMDRLIMETKIILNDY